MAGLLSYLGDSFFVTVPVSVPLNQKLASFGGTDPAVSCCPIAG